MSRLRMQLSLVVLGSLVLGSPVAFVHVGHAAEIGFIEDFATAKNRDQALKQLIPGTEDYYYYHCLHLQNNEQYDQVQTMLAAWIKRYNYTARVQEIRYRQALLTYERDPKASLEFIRRELGISFNHQREIVGQKPNLPVAVDPKLISRQTLLATALRSHKNTDGFEHRALGWLLQTELDPNRRRHLLARLQRPDHSNLARFVVDDLQHKYSKGFGSLNIHRQLLLSQLDECVRLKSDLLNQTHYVFAYLAKLQPNADVDWQHDEKEYDAYLTRLWKFTKRLAPVHNSLKAHVLYHRLDFNRSRGIYDHDLLMTYIKLPRNVSYIDQEYMKLDLNRRFPCNLNQDFRSQTLLSPVGNDESLVRSYLHHFFVDAETYKPYERYLNDIYLKQNFAETKIVNGLGESERWYSMLPPAKYQQLKQRIDLDFAHTNQEVFGADEPVTIDLFVKNVPSLIVKVYEINTKNFYRERYQEVNTDISLDGLVANVEETYDYSEAPLRRVGRHFDFNQLDQPGVYVIDFIGNGKSSRVVVRKGGLRYLVRSTTAGHVFTVVNDENERVKDATLWMAGREYQPDEDGLIVTPFSTNPRRQAIILQRGNFADLQYFQHEAENYQLTAGIYVDRESLLTRKKAQVLIRPGLSLNGNPVTLSLLEQVQLVITSVDHDGVVTTRTIEDFELFEDREGTFDFLVPQRLASISFQLKAKVENLSQSKKVDVAFADTFTLNGIDKTDKVEHLHLLTIDGVHILELLGRTGEPLVDRPVRLTLKHRDFKATVSTSLKTDPTGRIVLGKLPEIVSIQAISPANVTQSWPLLHDQTSAWQTMHGLSTRAIDVPFMSLTGEPDRRELSLLEHRGSTYVADRFAALSIKDGLLRVGKLPAGDYDLLDKTTGRKVLIRITDGEIEDDYALGDRRYLEVRGTKPLQIKSVDANEETLTIQLQNVTKFARVHLFATRYQPAYSAFARLDRVHDIEPNQMTYPMRESLYAEGRKIGDEYQYIINRRLATRFPGNMLTRPELLLNPWAIRGTETSTQAAADGDKFAPEQPAAPAGSNRAKRSERGRSGTQNFANLDFLADSSAIAVNLVADKAGKITIERKALGPHQHVHVVAVDPRSTVYRSASLPEVMGDRNDLRLVQGLDPEKHFTQQKQITYVSTGKKFEMPDISSSKFEAYDSLRRIYTLYTTLSNDAKLAEFDFILAWPSLKDDEKRAKYSEYACHELNFFLFKKDPKFFVDVVQPYLQNKKDSTFLDNWLTNAKLDRFVEPWHYEQLNVVERVLLSRRLKGERQYTSRHVRDTFNLLPPNTTRFNTLFRTALKSSELEADEKKFEAAKDSVARKSKLNMDGGSIGGGMFGGAGGRGSYSRKPQSAAASESSLADAPAPAPAADAAPRDSDASTEMESLREAPQRRYSRQLGQDKNGQANSYFGKARGRLQEQAQQLYRKLDTTKEWVENNYYHLPIENQNANLVTASAFWADYAQHDPAQPFYSVHLADASRNFTEMMFALSVLDVPFDAKEHKTAFDKTKMTIDAASPMIVFHEEIRPAELMDDQAPILVSQNFFRHGDRYRHENNQRLDKYVTDEFLVHVVYGCQVVVTNPTSAPRKLDLLLQVPLGAIPVLNGQYTKTANMQLQPYNTQTVEYYFYFPAPGSYEHYPVHVASNEEVMAHADPFTFTVVEELSKIDTESWAYVSQNGSEQDVLDYLKNANLHRTNLDKIAWRMPSKTFFDKVTTLLAARHAYNHTLWSYAIKHDAAKPINQYLQHSPNYLNRCGQSLQSSLVTIDPVLRKSYQHMEYKPLVNARAHQLGRRRQILNDRFHAQYHRLMKVLSYRRKLNSEDQLAVAYYMLLQDRVEDAMTAYGQVNARDLTTQVQYDYMTAYLSFYSEDQQIARDIVDEYTDHPVDRWRQAFAAISTQLDEIGGGATQVVDDENRDQQQTKLASSEPTFDFQVESKQVTCDYANLENVRVNYYLMDIELLFSRNPFVKKQSGQFSFIRPNDSVVIALPKGKEQFVFDLPKKLHNENVLVEIIGGGQTKTQAYYSNSLAVQLTENYGHLRVTHETTRKPLSKAYVKVYAQLRDGRVQFYKDGYTDLRGRFDYTSLNTNELDNVAKFSVLVMSEANGAVVREANPPKR